MKHAKSHFENETTPKMREAGSKAVVERVLRNPFPQIRRFPLQTSRCQPSTGRMLVLA
jgi:hypothetical protein